MGSKIIGLITVPKYITEVTLAKARKPKYIEKSDKMTKTQEKRLASGEYSFCAKYIGTRHKGILVDSNGNPVLKNPLSAGKPRLQRINGQDFYSGFSHHSVRQKIVQAIKEDFLPHFKKLNKVTQFPIQVDFIYYDEFNTKTTGKKTERKNQSKDIDNMRFAYEKCSLDLLTTIQKIPDDNLQFIRKISSEFIPSTERKLLIVIREYNQTNIIIE
jgi:hypothetical protein